MKYVHHPDLTCLVQAMCFDAEHGQIERYTFPFSASPSNVKTAVRKAVEAALAARRARRMTSGRMHVELDEDNPGSGRVVDHLPRGDGRQVVNGELVTIPSEIEAERIVIQPPAEELPEPKPAPVDESLIEIPTALTKQQLMVLMDARGAVNKRPHQIGETVYQPRKISLVGTTMEYQHGVYKGVIRLKRIEGETDAPSTEFSKLPGLRHKRHLVDQAG